jgi:hypothetical protein
MPQPNRAQWIVICTAAVVLVGGWPPAQGRSLGVKMINWIADPAGTLPPLPAALPMGLDDDGDAVAAHDARERDYYSAYERSRLNRWRMRLKEAEEPLDPVTERQLLVGIGVLSALLVWRLTSPRSTSPRASS